MPDSKRPHEADRVGDPLYCPYHRVLGHKIQDCFALKRKIKRLINEGTIDAELLKTIKKGKGKKVAASNMATYSCLTIDVFDEDNCPLHFPKEPVYVNKITLRSGTQLPDVQLPSPSVGASQAPPNQTASPNKIKYNVMAHLKKRPSLLSVYDTLCLSEDLRKALITALLCPFLKKTHAEVAKIDTSTAQCCSIKLSDEDLLLGTKLHNRPSNMDEYSSTTLSNADFDALGKEFAKEQWYTGRCKALYRNLSFFESYLK